MQKVPHNTGRAPRDMSTARGHIAIGPGKVKGNKMVDMQLSNEKLVKRGEKMLIEELGIQSIEAQKLLQKYGSVRNAIKHFTK